MKKRLLNNCFVGYNRLEQYEIIGNQENNPVLATSMISIYITLQL